MAQSSLKSVENNKGVQFPVCGADVWPAPLSTGGEGRGRKQVCPCFTSRTAPQEASNEHCISSCTTTATCIMFIHCRVNKMLHTSHPPPIFPACNLLSVSFHERSLLHCVQADSALPRSLCLHPCATNKVKTIEYKRFLSCCSLAVCVYAHSHMKHI